MVGFIKGFLGSKKREEVEVSEPVQETVQPQKPSGAYFLSADDARTFGNVDYMRTPKTIRRTFPSQNGEELELIQQVSAMGKVESKEETVEAAVETVKTVESSLSSTSSQVSEAVDRRRTDTSMDMFRSMARDMKK